MIALAQFALLRPLWLIAVPVVLVLAALTFRRAAALGGWKSAIEPHLMSALERRGAIVEGTGRRNGALSAAVVLMALALVGPAIERPAQESFRNLDGTVVVVDLSQSVSRSERFTEALNAAQLALSQSGTRQIGLVVFAGEAYLASPLTSDHAALGRLIFGLDARTVPIQGSRPAAGLQMAFDLLKGAGVVAGDIALVSDGGGLDEGAIALAARIGDAGYHVDTLYVPPAPGRPGKPELLAAVATAGGGVSADAFEPGAVTTALADAQATRIGQSDFSALAFVDLGPWLLLAAMLATLVLFRRSA